MKRHSLHKQPKLRMIMLSSLHRNSREISKPPLKHRLPKQVQALLLSQLHQTLKIELLMLLNL